MRLLFLTTLLCVIALPAQAAKVSPNQPPPSSPSWRSGRPHPHGFFVGGYWSSPWYYDAWSYYPPPPPYRGYYDSGYQFSPSTVATQTVSTAEGRSSVYTTGFLWGMDRRLRLVTKREIRKTLQAYWPTAPPEARDEFRRGFVDGYGPGGNEEFDKFLEKALKD